MSRIGAPSQKFAPEFSNYRVAVIAATWHEQIMDAQIIRVPGSFEIPVVARAAA
jgi:6,7-dimethyl-8-ribityllumazine synthase